jgi:hypothetical protein
LIPVQSGEAHERQAHQAGSDHRNRGCRGTERQCQRSVDPLADAGEQITRTSDEADGTASTKAEQQRLDRRS